MKILERIKCSNTWKNRLTAKKENEILGKCSGWKCNSISSCKYIKHHFREENVSNPIKSCSSCRHFRYRNFHTQPRFWRCFSVVNFKIIKTLYEWILLKFFSQSNDERLFFFSIWLKASHLTTRMRNYNASDPLKLFLDTRQTRRKSFYICNMFDPFSPHFPP